MANSTYGAGLVEMRSAGVVVLGYVPTGWGDRPVPSVEGDILAWHRWYSVSGIYLDQMYNLEYSSTSAYIPAYYSALTAYIKSLGYTTDFGNSGTDIPYYFMGSVTTIGYFENSHLPALSIRGGWHSNYTKSNFAFSSMTRPRSNPYYVAAASDYVGSLFITNGVRPFPYGSLPPYFDQLASELSSLVPVTVETLTPNGTSVDRGFQVTVVQPDGTSTTAHAPATFQVISGSKVTVTVRDDGGYVFDHWSGGSKARTVSLSPKQATTLVAYSSTSSSNASVVTVLTNETNNIPVVGIWTTVWTNGTMVAGGYTPFTWVATRTVNYTIVMQSFKTYTFSSWANGTSNQAINLVADRRHDHFTRTSSTGPLRGSLPPALRSPCGCPRIGFGAAP